MKKLSEVLNIFGILHSQGRIAYSKHGDRHERTANGDDECRSRNRSAMFFFCATLPLTLNFPKPSCVLKHAPKYYVCDLFCCLKKMK